MPNKLSPIRSLHPPSAASSRSVEWQGAGDGAGISIIDNHIEERGWGAKLHRHPYAETFLVRRGRVRIRVGEDEWIAEAGQLVVVPSGVAHAFVNPGPEPLEMIDIHESGSFVTEWLE